MQSAVLSTHCLGVASHPHFVVASSDSAIVNGCLEVGSFLVQSHWGVKCIARDRHRGRNLMARAVSEAGGDITGPGVRDKNRNRGASVASFSFSFSNSAQCNGFMSAYLKEGYAQASGAVKLQWTGTYIHVGSTRQ